MTLDSVPQILPAVMGSLRQKGAEGELCLEQNDGTRRMYWRNGDLVHLRSDVVGEQFGNYLLRQGILDFTALNDLMAKDEGGRLGEKVVQWGLMTEVERDCHLMSLQEQIMIHGLEHPILQMTWDPGEIDRHITKDLHFELKHRYFVWETFKEAHQLGKITDFLLQEADWKWVAPAPLLDSLSDLPLNPQMAYAFSFLGTEPIGFETFIHLSGMDGEDAARLIVTLWALGSLNLASGELPLLGKHAPPLAQEERPTRETPIVKIATPPPAPPPPQPTITPNLIPPILADKQSTSPLDSLAAPILSTDNVAEQPTTMKSGLLDDAAPLLIDEPKDTNETSGQKALRLFMKGKGLAQRDRPAEAIRTLEQGLQMDPDSEITYEPWLILGKLRMTNPAWSTRAIEALQNASRLRPRSAEPWGLMGELYHRKGFKTNALACFRKAMELDPCYTVPQGIDTREEKAKEPEPEAPPATLFNRMKSIWSKQSKE